MRKEDLQWDLWSVELEETTLGDVKGLSLLVGFAVGGVDVGGADGVALGLNVGGLEGVEDGTDVGLTVGLPDGADEGSGVGRGVEGLVGVATGGTGAGVGCFVGLLDGDAVGTGVGFVEGA